MHQLKDSLKPHRNTLYLVLACLVGLGIMFTMTVGKGILTRQRLERQLSEATRQAEIGELLAPLMTKLQDGSNAADPGIADDTNLQPMLDLDADNYLEVIEEMIRQCDLGPATVTPDIQSILSNTGYIRVNLTTRGTFSNFRHLIIQLGRLPYLAGIDRYSVQWTSDAAGLELFLRLHVQITSPTGNANDNE